MIEWNGPLCWTKGINMSISGMTESMKTKGILSFVSVVYDANLLKIYPKAKCPTANDLFSLPLFV
jgi:hypothetical protein